MLLRLFYCLFIFLCQDNIIYPHIHTFTLNFKFGLVSSPLVNSLPRNILTILNPIACIE